MDSIPENLTDLTDSATDDFHEPKHSDEGINFQDSYQCNSQSVLLPNIPSAEEISITMAEGKNPNSLLTDKSCEGPAFPYLFATNKYSYTVKWDVKFIPVKNFNQQLLSFT